MVLMRLGEVMERMEIRDMDLAYKAIISPMTATRARKQLNINRNTALRIARALDVSLQYLGASTDY